MKNKEPEKINIEKNTIGINFSESKKIKRYFDKNKNAWSKILIDIEKKTKIKLKSLRVEIENNQQ